MKDLKVFSLERENEPDCFELSADSSPDDFKAWAVRVKADQLKMEFDHIMKEHPFTILCFSMNDNQLQISQMESNSFEGHRWSIKGFYRKGNDVLGGAKNTVCYKRREVHALIYAFVKKTFMQTTEFRSKYGKFLEQARKLQIETDLQA